MFRVPYPAALVPIVALSLITSEVPAQSGPGGANPAASAPALQASVLDGEIRIDGRLDEPAWQRATAASGFTQSWPQPGMPPTERTEARVLFDADNLYVAVRMFDSAPDSIAAPLARRDASGIHSDWVHLIVDSRLDRRTAFRFTANPRGVQRDAYHYDDTQEDDSWVAVWEVATAIDSLGWTAEFRIPLSQLRFAGAAGDTRSWGLQIIRDVARRDERSTWSPWTRNDPGFVSRFGTLTGLHGLAAPRALELVPYLSTQITRAPAEPGNPLHRGTEPGAALGADLRLGLPYGMTLSATLNPDFGQVEADPAEVNLTAFETFFSERRPFFTEGADVFRFGEPRAFSQYGFQQFFYSRRIGRAPQRRLGGADHRFVDAPQQTRILGAAKVSGRTPGGWSLGVMNALTAREQAAFLAPDGEIDRAPVEPLTNYFVGRVRRDLRRGGTVLGGLLTATHRDLDDELVPLFHREAYLGGVDGVHYWADRAWRLGGYLAASHVGGSRDALLRTQHDPARYFQRPDAGHVELDPARGSLRGHAAELTVAHSGEWSGSLELKQVSPGFEFNDLGFHGRVDSRSAVTFLGRQVERSRGILRRQNYWITSFHAWNFDGDRILDGYRGNANVTFTNLWEAGVRGGVRPEHSDDRLTRGGPIAETPAQRELEGWVETDRRGVASLRLSARHWANSAGARERTLETRLELRPTAAVRLQLAPELARNRRTAQYVTTAADPTAVATYGARYVFADLDQTTVSMEVRLDWTLRPTLSLQLFAQPFVSAGEFSSFKEFAVPGGYEFDVYGVDRGTICRFGTTLVVDPAASRTCPNTAPPPGDGVFPLRFADPSFNLRSLRGNAVLRWEYRPGSTLFFVWQQDRSGADPRGEFDFRRDAGAVFREPARNVFLIKATYWLGG